MYRICQKETLQGAATERSFHLTHVQQANANLMLVFYLTCHQKQSGGYKTTSSKSLISQIFY